MDVKRDTPLRATRVVAVFACVLLIAGVAAGPVLADTQSQLNTAEKQLSDLINQIAAENTVIADDQAQANALAGQMDALQNQMARTQSQITGVQQALRAAALHLAATQAELDARAWAEYENGPGSGLEIVLGSSSLSDLNERVTLVNSAAATDEQLIRDIQQEKADLQAKRFRLVELRTLEQDQQQKLEEQEQEIQAKLADQQATLDQLTKDQASADALVKKLQAQRAAEIAAAKLAAELAAKERAQGGGSSGGGPSIGGVLFACPVDGAHAYADDFGAPRPGHIHAGVDITAAEGIPIVAPFPGNAVDSSDPGGGNDVYVYGSQGYVFNAHLSGYGATGSVSTGTVIGYVGATGDATGPHDHFEWHPKVIPSNPWTSPYGYSVVGTATDPFPYLNSVC